MQMQPLFGEEEKNALIDYMDEGGFLTEFRRTEKFEAMIAEQVGSKYCVVVNNGTVSLTLAALAAGVSAGDEVIVPNYTMVATPNSVRFFGAIPVFVDVEPTTLCMDIEKVKAAITPKTKAIMLVSANGRYPDAGIGEFERLADSKGIALIEDAAQSLGSYYPDGRHIGTAGLAGSFSFSAPKIISTGQGGAIVTNDSAVYSSLKKLKDFGRASGGNDVHDSIGYNFKFTELQACVGIEQMKKLTARVVRKKEIFSHYQKELNGCNTIKLFKHDLKNTAPWFFDCLVDDRGDLMEFLKARNIGTRVMYPPINAQRAYKSPGAFPVSERIGKRGLWLPSAVQLSDEELNYICASIREFYGE